MTNLSHLRILMFNRFMDVGGAEKVILNLCEALRGKVEYLGVISCNGSLVGELDSLGVRHFAIPDISDKNPATFSKVAATLKKVVKENNINLVHCHHRMAAFYCRLVLPKSVKVVATAHCVFQSSKFLTRVSYRNMHIAACGGRVEDNLVSYFNISQQQVTLIPNSVPCFNGKVKTIPEIADVSKEVLKIGFVGRLSEQKGIKFLISAMARLAQKNVPACCFIVGEGELEAELKQQVHISAASNNVFFLGRRDDAQNFLSQVDVCAMPSLWEGLPLVLLEAFSVGTPVVGSAVDGLIDVVRNGENGLLVKPTNVEALASALELVATDRNFLQSLGENALHDYNNNYSYDVWVRKYLDFYGKATL